MTFCPSCGAERKEGAQFCHNCGYNFETVNAGVNANINSNTVVNQGYNSNTQVNQNPIPNVGSNQDSHTFAKVLGYICAILIPLLGFIFGIYLYTRVEEDAKKHGKIMIGLSIFIWFIYFLLMS